MATSARIRDTFANEECEDSRPNQTYFESGFPHKKSQFISISGASWATMALALTLENTTSEGVPQ